MTTKITFTDDVGRISTASNLSGAIRWHVYERTIAGLTSIYVQRELSNVLQPEVKLLQSGTEPEVYFARDLAGAGLHQWVILYTLNENTWMLRVDEVTAPATQATQPATDTLVSGLAYNLGSDTSPFTVGQNIRESFGFVPSSHVYNGPPDIQSIGVAGSDTPGEFSVRWRAKASTLSDGNATWNYTPEQFYIAGFHVYFRDYITGQLTRLTASMIPFEGFDPKVYEYNVPAAAGTYQIVQVNYNGPSSTSTIEGHLGAPKDVLTGNGTTLPVLMDFMDRKVGNSTGFSFNVVTFAPLVVVAVDTFPSHVGSSFDYRDSVIDYGIAFVANISDTFNSHGPSDGFFARITQTGFGGVVIG